MPPSAPQFGGFPSIYAYTLCRTTTIFDVVTRGEGRVSWCQPRLPSPERSPIFGVLLLFMFGCQHGRAAQYLIDYCLPVSDVASRQHLRSASRRLLVVGLPRHRLSTYGRRAFAVAGPTAWNSFPDNLRDPDVTMDNFKRLLKTFLFSAYQCN